MSISDGQLEVVPTHKVTPDEAREAFVAIGSKEVSVAKVQQAVKAYEWLTQQGAKALATTDILNDLQFWNRVTEKYDKACMGEFTGGLHLQEEECLEYMKWRMEVSKFKVTANKALVDLCDGGAKQKTVQGVKASISRVGHLNPVAGKR